MIEVQSAQLRQVSRLERKLAHTSPVLSQVREQFLSDCAYVQEFFQQSSNTTEAAARVCELRQYAGTVMGAVLEREGVVYLQDDMFSDAWLRQLPPALGLFPKGHERRSRSAFLLRDRFVLPVRDVQGNVVSWVGWSPESRRKYVTANTLYFSLDNLFYGMERLGSAQGSQVAVVEGIFDRLMLESVGVPTMGVMTARMSPTKKALLSLFSRVLGFPDMDAVGERIVAQDQWFSQVSTLGQYVRWSAFYAAVQKEASVAVKDIDTLGVVLGSSQLRQVLEPVLVGVDQVSQRVQLSMS